MLIMAKGNCSKCNKQFEGTETEQGVQVTCTHCGRRYKMCYQCQTQGCPNCGGRLKSLSEEAFEKGMMF